MIANYILVAVRKFFRNGSFTFINVFGIVAGMSVSICIMQYFIFQKSYDNFHGKSSNIYRIITEVLQDGKVTGAFATAPAPMEGLCKKGFSEVVDVARIYKIPSGIVKYEAAVFKETKIFCTDASFFKIFNFKLIAGRFPENNDEISTVIITQSVAKRYFGGNDPIGKIIELDGLPMTVKGVIEDIPKNSHFTVDFIFPLENVLRAKGNANENWRGLAYQTYALFQDRVDVADFENRLNREAKKNRGDQFGKDGREDVYHLQKLKEIHLKSHLLYELGNNADNTMLGFLLVLAVFVLTIAWLNYISLTTVSNLKRVREVGVRMAMGAQRAQLIGQFMGEALLINLAAALISLIVVYFCGTLLSNSLGVDIDASVWTSSKFWLLFVITSVIGTVLSGGIPALLVSTVKPQLALKGKLRSSSLETNMRRIFTVLQYVFSAFLITSTIVIGKQLGFLKSQSIGVNIDKTLTVRMPFFLQRDPENVDFFKNEIKGFHAVKSVASSTLVPGIDYNTTAEVKTVNAEQKSVVQMIGIDNDFLDSFELKILKGRGYDKGYRTTDNEAIMINSRAAQIMGISDIEEGNPPKINIANVNCEVIGIVQDYSHKTLKSVQEPIIFYWRPRSEYISVKISSAPQIPETLAFVEKKYKTIFSEAPFEYFFLDDLYNEQYKSDDQFSAIFRILSILSILISSMGLLGLNLYNVKQRTKELGMRKVLGATTSQLVQILVKDLLLLIIIGNLFAWIATYFVMGDWLEGFAQRVTPHWSWYLTSTIIILLISFFVVSYHTIKASLANPVTALRHE